MSGGGNDRVKPQQVCKRLGNGGVPAASCGKHGAEENFPSTDAVPVLVVDINAPIASTIERNEPRQSATRLRLLVT
jgi:hypothetical protein